MTDEHDVIVVGGGQAGLAIGYLLAREGRRFTILEAAPAPASAWRVPRGADEPWGTRVTCRRAGCWWWAAATRAFRSPKSCRAPTRCISRSAPGRRRCRNASRA